MNFNKKTSIAALALLIASGSVFAQVKKKPLTHKKPTTAAASTAKADLLPVDANVIIGKLPNGLTYYIRQNSEPQNRAVLYLVNKAGSVLETDQQQGLAHFTEHMAFDGTKDFSKDQLADYMQKSGIKFGADFSASANFDETVYQLSVPTDTASVFEQGFKILANWAGSVTFDPADVDKERGVILEESRLRGKNAQERLQQQLLPALLGNSRYATRMPIGKDEVIKTADAATIKTFYRDWYRPDLQAVIAVGDFDVKQVQQFIINAFSGLKNPLAEKPRPRYADAGSPGTSVVMATDPEFSYDVAEIVVKHPETTVKTTADYLQSVRISLFNQMLNARLNQLAQQPFPPFAIGQASYGGFIGHQDAFTSIVAVKPGEDFHVAVKAMVAETERVRKFGFTLTELERAKQNELEQLQNAYKEKDKTQSISFVNEYEGNFLNDQGIPGIDYEYNFYVNNLGNITLPEMNAMAGHFITDQNRVVIVEAPDAEKSKLPDEKTLLGWISTAGDSVTAYVDNISTEPVLSRDRIPRGSRVVSEKRDDSLGVATLLLSNGVKIILKPTDFKNDQILISGYSFGGTSLASDQDFISANLAAGIISSSGVGDRTQTQLTKLLIGKSIAMSPYISETAQGISGNSTPADLESALQLLYLYFTQPRKDPAVWQSGITEAKAFLAKRDLDPTNVYKDTITAVLNSYNFRNMVTTTDQLNSASLDKAYNFYKDRFADASGFTFTLVGNFSIDEITPLLETYLGGLPSSNDSVKHAYKNLNIHPPVGQITKTVYKGTDSKSTVQLVFSGDYDYSVVNNMQMDAIESILQLKLAERMHTLDSSVYAPGVRADYVKIPDGRYTFSIYLVCAPENVDKLTAAVLDEINKIKQNGALQTDIQKFVSGDIQSTEVQLRQNYYWAGYLAGGAQNDEDPHRILRHVTDLDKVTVQSTKDIANKYLSGNNLIKFILMPEKK